MDRRAKIVCTLGPATSTPERVRELIDAGMNVARLNFSHGDRVDHLAALRTVREVAAEVGRPVAVLADLQGPKIRLGRFAAGSVEWAVGDTITVTTADCAGQRDRIGTTYSGLARDVDVGDRMLVDDGKVELRVRHVTGDDIDCVVERGGRVSDHKGISLPGVDVAVPAVSGKDAEDLRFALEAGVDLVAMSFVRAPQDVKDAHSIMDDVGVRLPVVAKLEKPEAVTHLLEIVEAFDGIMVARGDLGIELPAERVPLVQKQAIQLCRQQAKPVIVATQMLEAMVTEAQPTRAEVSDVANAVLDGADAVMLSGETSVGAHPVHTVATMARIVAHAETEAGRFLPLLGHTAQTVPESIAAAACEVGSRLGAAALCCFTRTGETARRLARHHSGLPLLAFTPDERVRDQLSLCWGVRSFVLPQVGTDDETIEQLHTALPEGLGLLGDSVVVVSGTRSGVPGSTNVLRVLRLDSVAGGAR